MESNRISIRKVLRRNFREIIFVFLAFALMTAAAYFSVGRIIRERLLDRSEEMIYTAEANVRAGLSEAEAILLNTCHLVQGMTEQDASMQEILDYLTITTEWVRQRDHGLFCYNGIYGYINGEFYDSMGFTGGDYSYHAQSWYQVAVQSGAEVGYTAPYKDACTGETIVSAVRNIFNADGRIIGILTIDIEISWLTEYVSSLAAASGGYGILINQDMTLMAYPDSELIGLQLQDLGGTYELIVRILRSGNDVLARRTEDAKGRSAIVFFTRIFNGWYVGIAVPYFQFFRDLYISALILVILGLGLSLALCYLLLRLSAARMRADEENRYKSSFLASMSHEIRTPMNAITGMAELLLREQLSEEAHSYAKDIKQAGTNLLSIINDILDFSKVEAGKLEIIPAKYLFSSLVNDTINIIRIRLTGKPIQFYTDIDANIPNGLIGDIVRIRQIFINLLSNAVKYTEQGSVTFSVKVEKIIDDQVWLKARISDTGMGIKAEDQKRLFDDFVQLDTKKNRNIEGTGLGLAITRRLCIAMGGDISMESEYGKGSTFTVIIPQKIESIASYADAENMGTDAEGTGITKFTIPEARLLVVDDVPTNLKVAEGLLSPYRATVDTCDSGAESIKLIMKRNYDIVFMDHMMPDMDGIEVTAHIRAWEKEQRTGNGAMIPIIALTANALVGMRETFLQNGFSDFLSKPIEISKLDEIIDRWIPDKKKIKMSGDGLTGRENPSALCDIPGVDAKRGIATTGGTAEGYRTVLSMFRRDAEKRLPLFQTMPDTDTLPVFITQVHAIKSAASSIGANEVSGKAAELESAAVAGELAFIEKNLRTFAEQLAEVVKHISAAEMAHNERVQNGKQPGKNVPPDFTLLRELEQALATGKASSDIFGILDKIEQMPLDSEYKGIFEKISYHVLMNEFDAAINTIGELKEKI